MHEGRRVWLESSFGGIAIAREGDHGSLKMREEDGVKG